MNKSRAETLLDAAAVLLKKWESPLEAMSDEELLSRTRELVIRIDEYYKARKDMEEYSRKDAEITAALMREKGLRPGSPSYETSAADYSRSCFGAAKK